MKRWLHGLLRWLWNKNELDRIGSELQMIRILLQGPPKQLEALKPLQPLGRETRQRA